MSKQIVFQNVKKMSKIFDDILDDFEKGKLSVRKLMYEYGQDIYDIKNVITDETKAIGTLCDTCVHMKRTRYTISEPTALYVYCNLEKSAKRDAGLYQTECSKYCKVEEELIAS